MCRPAGSTRSLPRARAAAASFTALRPVPEFQGLVREQVGAMFVDRGWSQVRAIGIIRVYYRPWRSSGSGEDIAQSVLSNYADSYDRVAKEVPPLAKCPVPPDRDIRIALRYADQRRQTRFPGSGPTSRCCSLDPFAGHGRATGAAPRPQRSPAKGGGGGFCRGAASSIPRTAGFVAGGARAAGGAGF